MAIPAEVKKLINAAHEETVGLSDTKIRDFLALQVIKGLVAADVRKSDTGLADARADYVVAEAALNEAAQAVLDAKDAVPAKVKIEVAKIK